jgi:hypothetical protein
MSAFTHLLPYVGSPALIVAVAHSAKPAFRSLLLYRAGSTALKRGSEDERGKAGLAIVKALTREEPWYRALIPWRKSGDDEP